MIVEYVTILKRFNLLLKAGQCNDFQALRIHQATVVCHINGHLQSEKLKTENGGSQTQPSADQTNQRIEHLADYTYFHTHQIVAYEKKLWYSLQHNKYE